VHHVGLKLRCNRRKISVIPCNPANVAAPDLNPVDMELATGSSNGGWKHFSLPLPGKKVNFRGIGQRHQSASEIGRMPRDAVEAARSG
jgi:hypothetical protein